MVWFLSVFLFLAKTQEQHAFCFYWVISPCSRFLKRHLFLRAFETFKNQLKRINSLTPSKKRNHRRPMWSWKTRLVYSRVELFPILLDCLRIGVSLSMKKFEETFPKAKELWNNFEIRQLEDKIVCYAVVKREWMFHVRRGEARIEKKGVITASVK